MSTIVLTGGGTAGHVTPNLAIKPILEGAGYSLAYIGSQSGMERTLIEGQMPYYGIATGKLRRYFNPKNFSDPFRVVKGYFEARAILKKLAPVAVFSKGGYVAVPVVLAAHNLRIPVVIHESDFTPGLATKLCAPRAQTVCVTFPETANHFKNGRVTGTAVRPELFCGKAEKALARYGLPAKKPLLLVMGGSLGSKVLNQAVRGILPRLLAGYSVVHLCGKGHLDSTSRAGYIQLEYANEELPDILAAAALVVSRAGSNSINEFLALKLPMLLVPLSRQFSRGDQIENAVAFEKAGFACVLEEEALNADTLFAGIAKAAEKRQEMMGRMQACSLREGTAAIAQAVLEAAKKGER